MASAGRAAERALVVECLLALGEPRPRIAQLVSRVDAAALVELARSVGVVETVGHALLAAGLLGSLTSAAAAAALREGLENSAAKNVLLVAEAAAFQAALSRAGIRSVVLKGTALLAAHLPAPGARHVGDLDLLVDPARLADAAEVLRSAGCTQDGLPPDTLVLGHHLPQLRTPGGLACELHWGLPGCDDAGRVGAVLDRAREVDWRSRHLRVPSVDDLIGIASIHALGHHRGDVRFLPRLVADLVLLLREGGSFEAAGRLHPGRELDRGRALLERVRAGDADEPFRSLPAWEGIALRARGLAKRLAHAGRRGAVRRLFFPTLDFLATRYGVARSSPWLPLLYLWRPLGALLRVAAGR